MYWFGCLLIGVGAIISCFIRPISTRPWQLESLYEKTGESPYRISYNRDPVVGADVFIGNYPKDDHVKEKSADQISSELYKWFERIAKKQQLLADRAVEKKNAKENRKEPMFKNNDWVLLFEPPVTHTTVKRRPWSIPRKFQDVLTGPHRVISDKCNAKGELKMFHSRREREEYVHKSRLVLYNPWSDQLLDTAGGSTMVPGYDIRSKPIQAQGDGQGEAKIQEYRSGDDVMWGEFAAIAIDPDNVHSNPFMIAKIYEIGTYENAEEVDGVKYRSIKARIYGNTNSDPTKVYRPGWVDKKNL